MIFQKAIIEEEQNHSRIFFPKGRKDANDCTKDELIRLEKVYL